MRSQRLAGGLVVLLIGLMFLLANMGLMGLGVWGLMIRYWPLLLVIGGVVILLGWGFRWFVVMLLTVVIVLGVIGGPTVYDWQTGPLTRQTFVPPADAGEVVALDIDLSFDVPSIRTGDPVESAYSLDLGYRRADPPKVSFVPGEDGAGRLTLRQETASRVVTDTRQNLELAFRSGTRVDLGIQAGVASLDLNFQPYQLEAFNVNAGVLNAELRLGPPTGATRSRIKSGVGDVTIWVPHGAPVRVVADVGLGSRNLAGAGLVQAGNTWRDGNFDGATDRLEIDVDLGVGRLAVKRY